MTIKKKLLGLLALGLAGAMAGAFVFAQNAPTSPANIAGTLYASNFARWSIQKGDSGNFSWSNISQCTVNSNGVTFPAFVVGMPVKIVDSNPANSETVIPTAVTMNNTGCRITVNPVHQHFSFFLQSATAGLQEAINYANAQNPPYMVYVTPDFTRLGGTTGTITSALGNSQVTIQDARTSVIVPYLWNGSAYAAQAFGTPGVASINSVLGDFTFSGSGVSCTLTTCTFSGGTGTNLPGTQKLLGTYQTTGSVLGPTINTQDAIGYQLQGFFNSDLYQTGGGNNGVENLQTLCGTNTNCGITIPPNSTSTDLSITLGVTANNNSFAFLDNRYNSKGEYFTNPAPSSFSNFQFQNAYGRSTAYTVNNPGPALQGGSQAVFEDFNLQLAAGHSLGQAGCPHFCPMAGYSNVSEWASPTYRSTTNYYAGEGIHGSAENNFFNSRGDSYPYYLYTYYHGGCDSPSDECNYVEGASHGITQNDWAGTIATITDPYHFTATTTGGNADQGRGLWVLDFTNYLENLQNVAIIHAPEDSSSSYPYGTVVFDSAAPNIPVSYAIGTLVSDCDVPVQQGGEAATSCTVHSNSGPFTVSNSSAPDGSGLFCAASNAYGNMIYGAQITAVTSPDGSGNQVITFTTDRSVAAIGNQSVPSVAAQGGACGTVVMFNADTTNLQGGGLVLGSTFPVFVSPDNHTVGYANYYASGNWKGAPNNGSRMRTEASAIGSNQGIFPGGIPIANVSRVGGKLIATAFDQAIPPVSDTLVGQFNTTISGCSDSSVNGFQSGAGGWSRNASGQLTILQAGSDTTCSGGAYVTLGQTGTSLYWAAKALDVTNHTPGVLPIANLNNPVFATTYQPHFVVGHAVEQAAHYAAQSTGHRTSMEFVQPQESQTLGHVLNMQNYNAVAGVGYSVFIQPLAGSLAGLGGVQSPLTPYAIDGAPPSNALASTYQPIHNGCGMCFGGSIYNNNNLGMQEFDFLGVNQQQQSLHYNNATATWSFSSQSNHYDSFSPSGNFFGPPTFISSLTYGAFALFPAARNFVGTTTIGDCSTQQGSGTTCYDNASVGPPVVGQVGTPGTSLYNYVLGLNYPDGISLTPAGQQFFGNATLNTSNYNTVSCSVLPTGMTANVYEYDTTTFGALNIIGTCSSPSTTINDQGTRGTLLGGSYINMTARINAGGFTANGNGLGYCFSIQNLFHVITTVGVPASGCMSSPTAGIYSFDTTTPGDAQGQIKAGSASFSGTKFPIGSGVSGNTDLNGHLTLTGGTATYSFTSTGITNAPECTASDATAVAAVQVITSTTALTINGTAGDVVHYVCSGH